MNQNSLALIIGAVIAAVNNLDKYKNLLDGVTGLDGNSQEMNTNLAIEHKNVIGRLDAIVTQLRNAQNDPEETISLNVYEMFSVNKAVNENIVEHEKALAYFSQMGFAEQSVASFQEKIRGLSFAMFELTSVNNVSDNHM
jgi:hypothetical protein